MMDVPPIRRHLAALAAVLLVCTGLALTSAPASARLHDGSRPGVGERPTAGFLADRIIVLDPGHQLGNSRHPAQVNAPVPSGEPGVTKPCNAVGSETADGIAEATVNWQIARQVQTALQQHGARVAMTRESNRGDRWGPCVDERGRAGNDLNADLMISIHADGAEDPDARGFHVIAPTEAHPASGPSARFAGSLRDALAADLPVANYVGEDGLDERGDLATLNHAEVPTVMVELGNLRAAADARRLTTPAGQSAYADALTCGVLRHLSRANC